MQDKGSRMGRMEGMYRSIPITPIIPILNPDRNLEVYVGAQAQLVMLDTARSSRRTIPAWFAATAA